jgi:hypothetical protein
VPVYTAKTVIASLLYVRSFSTATLALSHVLVLSFCYCPIFGFGISRSQLTSQRKDRFLRSVRFPRSMRKSVV